MASKHLQIRQAVSLALADVVQGRVRQNRNFNLPTGVDSQVHVNFRGSEPERGGIAGAPIDWATEIEFVILARKVADQDASDVADAIWAEVFGLLMADQSLGGLAAYIEPGSAHVEDGEADTTTCRLTWSITVQHRTNNNAIA